MTNLQIWKYGPFQPNECFDKVLVPDGGVIRHFGEQGGELFVWIDIVPDAPRDWREFIVIGTGLDIPPLSIYRGTCVHSSGFVWHLFERG